MSLEGQLNAQKDSQAIIHQDQSEFMNRLSELKGRMETLIVRYNNREFSLWDFALL